MQRLGGGVVIDVPSHFGNGYRLGGDASGDMADGPNVTTEWQSLGDRVLLLPPSHAAAIEIQIRTHVFSNRVPRGKGGRVIPTARAAPTIVAYRYHSNPSPRMSWSSKQNNAHLDRRRLRKHLPICDIPDDTAYPARPLYFSRAGRTSVRRGEARRD